MFGKQARYKEWKAYSRRLLKYLPRASLFIVHYVVVVLRMASDPFCLRRREQHLASCSFFGAKTRVYRATQ